MPAKVLPSAHDFTLFCQWMEALDYRRISKAEFRSDFVRLGLKAPRPRKGREVGYAFYACDLEVRVWTTILEPEGYARDKDAGWITIRDGDRARYFSHPLPRTRNFLSMLYRQAVVAQKRILHRPLCPACKAYMRIAYGKGLKSRYWECRKLADHPDSAPTFVPWDYGLKQYPKVLAFVKARRKRRKPYRKKLHAEGKKPGKAMFRRKPWRITHPENLV